MFLCLKGVALMSDRQYAFCHILDNGENRIDSTKALELSLVLKKKQKNRPFVIETTNRIISEKQFLLKNGLKEPSICFVGHSQLDQWPVQEISGYKVRNCGISGISSFEYYEKILSKNMLNCNADIFLVMHGTNDIVWDYSTEEIVRSIRRTIEYIRENNSKSPIFFVSCLHVNGRLDRNNDRIDELNRSLKYALSNSVFWIDTSFMNDEFGNLDIKFTQDGLHINDLGYITLLKKIQEIMGDIGL